MVLNTCLVVYLFVFLAVAEPSYWLFGFPFFAFVYIRFLYDIVYEFYIIVICFFVYIIIWIFEPLYSVRMGV